MTEHRIINMNSNTLKGIGDKEIDLIITSPPYPMIEMWDKIFIEQDNTIQDDINKGNGNIVFNKMHNILNRTWKECDRVLKDNGFICINIGDATRTINNIFQLYSNHSEIIKYFYSLGYSVLPDIHWSKRTNAPNKFMGSGMYPAGAYVTYEHEYILIFRKGGKREFKGEDKKLRQKSAYFWEERNIWFSDLWDIKGINQKINSKGRSRSGAYPIEIPYRLVNMYSIEGDMILDPFCGLGTTNLACMAANRNSIGVEINKDIIDIAINNIMDKSKLINDIIDTRIKNHIEFINSLSEEQKSKCYINNTYNFLVKTKQEINIKINKIKDIDVKKQNITCKYE